MYVKFLLSLLLCVIHIHMQYSLMCMIKGQLAGVAPSHWGFWRSNLRCQGYMAKAFTHQAILPAHVLQNCTFILYIKGLKCIVSV